MKPIKKRIQPARDVNDITPNTLVSTFNIRLQEAPWSFNNSYSAATLTKDLQIESMPASYVSCRDMNNMIIKNKC